jgi:hypothetical protein
MDGGARQAVDPAIASFYEQTPLASCRVGDASFARAPRCRRRHRTIGQPCMIGNLFRRRAVFVSPDDSAKDGL